MALRLNLYHEVLLTRRQEQYDPLKLSVLAMITVALGLVGYYFVEVSRTNTAKNAASAAQAEYKALVPKETAAKKRAEELSAEITLADRLTERTEGRFHWASLLDLLASVVPPGVQLQKLTGDVSGRAPQKCQLTIEGLAAGSEPRQIAETVRMALVEKLGGTFTNVSAVFKSLDESREKVILEGNHFQTATFSIGISFETKTGELQAPEPSKAAASIAKKD